jgi:hypothetical protein
MKKRIEFIQAELKNRGLYAGVIDGIAGSDTITALSKVTGLDPSWNATRKITGFIQLLCLDNGISPGDIDGYWGAQTEFAFNQYLYFKAHGSLPEPWRPEDRTPVNPNHWPVQYTMGFDEFYGPRGSSLVRIELPYPQRLAWNTRTVISSFSCHSKVQESLQRILGKVLIQYGLDEIKRLGLDLWGGCYNERLIRGGSRWSMHSWGIALDFDPARNKLEWGRDKAAFSRPEYETWWKCWEEEGWVSLGRQRNFDWMHVQAALI